jgi:hypothetical protein
MITISKSCECGETVMGHFAKIEEATACLKALMVEAGMYDENGELDRTAADYADAPASVTE